MRELKFLFFIAVLVGEATIVLQLAWTACGRVSEQDLAAGCIEEFSPENGGTFESDADRCSDDSCDPTVVQATCEASGGEYCSADDFITRQAAVCLAKAEGLSEEVAVALTHLVYNVRHGVPIWSVSEIREQDATSRRGRTYEVHAVTGEVLDILGFSETAR